MAKSFRCRLVTPAASLVDDEVKYVQLPAWDGSMGFLPGRAPILARLGVGELRLDFADGAKGEGGTRSFVVDGGVARMAGDELMVLAERAIPAETLTSAAAEAELRAAESKHVTPGSKDSAAELAKINRERELARAKVRAASGKRGI